MLKPDLRVCLGCEVSALAQQAGAVGTGRWHWHRQAGVTGPAGRCCGHRQAGISGTGRQVLFGTGRQVPWAQVLWAQAGRCCGHRKVALAQQAGAMGTGAVGTAGRCRWQRRRGSGSCVVPVFSNALVPALM